MARSLTSKPNTNVPSVVFPHGRIRDNNGTNNGTPFNEEVYGDFHQFFAEMFYQSGQVYNNLPESDPTNGNGYQFYEALKIVTRIFDLTGFNGFGIVSPSRKPIFYINGADIVPGQTPVGLPASAATDNGQWVIMKSVNPDGTLLVPDGTDTIEGSVSSYEVALGEIVQLVLDKANGNWIILSERKLRRKVLPIVWDMNTNALINMPHGLTASKIINVRASIRDDLGAFFLPLVQVTGNTLRGGGTIMWDATNVTLRRFSAVESNSMFGFTAQFESASYSSAGIVRGYLTIEYIG